MLSAAVAGYFVASCMATLSVCNALLTMSSLILIVSLDGIPLFRSVISWMRSWSMLLGPSFIISR